MLTFYHAPQSRSSRVLWLLEELATPYELVYTNVVRMDGSGGIDPRNPHPDKKVPAIVHDGVVITESIAIALYLTDAFPKAGIGPQIGDPLRGPYLTWLAYYAGVVEPVVHFQFLNIGDNPALQRTFRGRAEMDARVLGALARGPYLLGERFSAVDILFTSLGQYMRNMLPAGEPIDGYLGRCGTRPAAEIARGKDAPR
jgi:glutathione S-transferase